MSKLIKAEWYRITHSTKFVRWLILISLCIILLPVLSDTEVFEKNIYDNLLSVKEIYPMFLPMFMGAFASIMIGITYINKTANYEIMTGNKISHILGSKIIADTSFLMLGVVTAIGLYLLIIGIMNGVGDIDKPFLRIFLMLVVMIHICINGVLITTSIRHIGGAVVAFLRFEVIEGLSVNILQNICDNMDNMEKLDEILDWFISNQIVAILTQDVSGRLVAVIILSGIFEGTFWYLLSYYRLKKKI